jgi:toxin-antitoxin system, toxin component, Txe/YoeB family
VKKVWSDEAWEEYLYWQTQDKKIIKRINNLIKDIDRNGYNCIGKPEQLSGNLAGYWSVRIDKANRIVFKIVNDTFNVVPIIETNNTKKEQ